MKMFKISSILSLLVLCLFIEPLMAQQGAFMLYGSLNYQNNNNSGTTFGANPFGVGYFFNDHVVAGLNYGFSWQKNNAHDKLFDHHEIGPFYSDSWSLGKYFVFIAQVDAHYVWGDQNLNTNTPYGYKGYLFRVYPLVSVVLGHGWALKAKFFELSFQRTKGDDMERTVDRTFIAGVNGSTIGLGVSKNISFKKHGS